MKLFTNLGNIHALKILICSSEANVKIDVEYERTIESISQGHSLPVLQTTPGDPIIFSANAAATLVYGSDSAASPTEQAHSDSWLEWESTQLQPISHRFVSSSLSGNTKESGETLQPLLALLDHLQTSLQGQDFILGEALSVADVVLWSALFPFFNAAAPFKVVRDSLGVLAAWFDRLSVRPAFVSAAQTLFHGQVKQHLKVAVQAQTPPPLPVVSKNVPQRPVSSQPATEDGHEDLASDEEKALATDAWLNGRQSIMAPRLREHPILPQTGERNYLITSALPYVNNVPHLGNIIGCVLSADVFSRFCRLRGYNCLYICGTDEYGTATETKAVQEGLTPQQICDKYNTIHADIYRWFNIDFDYFGRTTTPQQTKIAQDIFWDLYNNGYILKQSTEQLQCQNCDRFLADRFVEGTCPLCAYEDARGDQCDKCGKLINAIDLIMPRCNMCKQAPKVRTSDHLFLDLPTLAPSLSEYLDGQFESGIWSTNTKVITKSWLRDGLKPRCISRDLKWGTPVPLQGYTDKVFYVWYDAPIGYISITANYTDQWQQWWNNPEQVELFNFMAKDNVPFHSVIFPCTLLGTQKSWSIVNHLSATEYLNYEDGKFSKSRGVGVFGNNARDTGIPADVWRFYLLFLRPESQDSCFNWDDFVLKNNSELLNNLGNFINRALMFVGNTFGGQVPAVTLSEDDQQLLALITRELQAYNRNLDKISLRDGIRNILTISRLGNQYIQANKPWVLVKSKEHREMSRGGSVVGLAANVSCLLSTLIQPYMPQVSAEIQSQLNAPSECNVLTDKFVCWLPAGHQIGKPSPLFKKLEESQAQELKKQFAGTQSERSPIKVESKPGGEKATPAAAPPTASPEEVTSLTEAVNAQGGVVRQLKASKAEKCAIDDEVKKLLDLKSRLSLAQGVHPKAAPAAAASGGKGKKNKKKK